MTNGADQQFNVGDLVLINDESSNLFDAPGLVMLKKYEMLEKYPVLYIFVDEGELWRVVASAARFYLEVVQRKPK